MSQELICITCPMGCHLSVEKAEGGELSVSGNRCPRGAAYAREELFAPKRVVTATARAARACAGADSCAEAGRAQGLLDAPRRVPVRTAAAFPKERVGELLERLYALEVELPVERGQVLVPDALGTGIDVIATRSIK
ncbi:MAG TPA: DUF1667 domain-containing protein [Spirochaetia bacterium]|nr:DUF1667 domain-containing protein [Spirochaetales bacterium]HRY72365.1 DUF1667 domain-containing protein [Spirochaetia bacterium]